MELQRENISSDDINFLKEIFSYSKIEFFRESIFKTKIQDALYFMFPFSSPDKEILGHQLSNINFNKKIIYSTRPPSFWVHNINSSFDFEYLFVSDNPMSIIKYFSRNYSLYKNKKVLCVAHLISSNESISLIKKNYKVNKVITIYDNPSNKAVLRLKTSFIYSNLHLQITKKKEGYLLSHKKKEFFFDSINTTYLKSIFNIKNEVRHKEN